MAVLEIKKYNNSILKKRAKEVRTFTPGLKELILNMKETMKRAEGIGLAGPQVGESKRVIIVQTSQGPQSFLNPKIIKKARKIENVEEGCLSLPGLFLEIKRSKEVDIEALNEKGEKVIIKARGLLARIFQHEIDHLDGILLIDKVGFWKKRKLNLKNRVFD